MAVLRERKIARAILAGFDRHYCLFHEITAGARDRFERADWAAVQHASRERIHFYDQRVRETVDMLREVFDVGALDERLWRHVKIEYVARLHQHEQPELAETFYNSVFCRLFHRRYYNNRNIFVRPAIATEHRESDVPAYRSYYPARDGFARVIGEVLGGFGFSVPFEDRRRDVRNLLRAIRDRFPDAAERRQNFQLAVLTEPFFRNKAAYIIGKAVNGPDEIPFAVPLLNNGRGALYVDALLAGESELANLFSFARAYFMVDTATPCAVVDFLLRMLPCKTKADLYTSIGLQKHGKTEFYRDFLHHLRHSGDAFVRAPGTRGMVMTVFTLPSYPYVFKVIKDRFPPAKDMTQEEVKRKYQLVKQHDRVGRMADSWEYSEAAFPLERFSPDLLEELRTEAASGIEIEDGQIIVGHVYIERRMTPLNVYVKDADDIQLRRIVGDYGAAIRELATADIFPGDMFLKNFGVTRQGRVVFYDYDEICYLRDCSFREVPDPPYPEYEMAAEPWYSVGPHDVFPEEFATFLLTDPRVRRAFMDLNTELLDAGYWQRTQARVREGVLEDVFPYPDERRFDRPVSAPRQQSPSERIRVAGAACG
ncbi:MAG: bifunctional isocitrate dehydrogenase kinase/phosphatase [Chromatiales bacterium]|jgi:isocitrate dehydrogenase kinase/phosphatase